jgi:hypothetical protein
VSDHKLAGQAALQLLEELLSAADVDDLRKQLPPAPPPVSTIDEPIDLTAGYLGDPPNMRVIPLLKQKYANQKQADLRAVEILHKTGERLHRKFHTARAYCYQVFTPYKIGESFR